MPPGMHPERIAGHSEPALFIPADAPAHRPTPHRKARTTR
jgi:hypothetical protein